MSSARRSRSPRPSDCDVGGWTPPYELFGRVLGRYIPDAHLPFEERVDRALVRLMAGFQEDEHERLREALVVRITADKREEA